MYKWERRERKLESKRRREPKHGRGLKTFQAIEEARIRAERREE